jgi:hypothetical protein
MKIGLGRIPATVKVEVRLPGQGGWTSFDNLTIVDGVVIIPIAQAFLCHAKEDKSIVRGIAHRLLSDGYMVWFDEVDLVAGADWEREIEAAIERCDYAIIFLSRNSCSKTGYVQREIRYALEQHERRPLGQRFIIPVMLDDVAPPREFSSFHWLKVSRDNWYEQLCRALKL